MDLVLIILGVLGFGAIVIAAYVFTVAARNYVSEDSLTETHIGSPRGAGTPHLPRSPTDRRQNTTIQFPLTVNSVVIDKDRRCYKERRSAAA